MKNKLNSIFRHLLFPFVVIGWAVARFFRGMQLMSFIPIGKVAGSMCLIVVLGLCLLGLIPLNKFILQIAPEIVVAAIDALVAILIIIGLIRGAIYAFDDVKYDETVHSHFIDPIDLQKIITTLFIVIISGLFFFAFLKLIKG